MCPGFDGSKCEPTCEEVGPNFMGLWGSDGVDLKQLQCQIVRKVMSIYVKMRYTCMLNSSARNTPKGSEAAVGRWSEYLRACHGFSFSAVTWSTRAM